MFNVPTNVWEEIAKTGPAPATRWARAMAGGQEAIDKLLSQVPPPGDPLVVRRDGERVSIGTLRSDCQWQPVSGTLTKVPPVRDWIASLALAYTPPRGRIVTGGVAKEVEQVPNVASRDPSGLNRTTATPSNAPSNTVPAVTILPSGCKATAPARLYARPIPALPSGQHVAVDPAPLNKLLLESDSPFNAHHIMAIERVDDLFGWLDLLPLKPTGLLAAEERGVAQPITGALAELNLGVREGTPRNAAIRRRSAALFRGVDAKSGRPASCPCLRDPACATDPERTMMNRAFIDMINSIPVSRDEINREKNDRRTSGVPYKYMVGVEMKSSEFISIAASSDETRSLLRLVTLMGLLTLATGLAAIVLLIFVDWKWALAFGALSYLGFNQIQISLNYELIARVDVIHAKMLDHPTYKQVMASPI